tara:strand:+ start:770 stop:994 length:225 start_codon:yes stop_codon:yes gene_type:complete
MIALITQLVPLLLNLLNALITKYSKSNQAKEMILELIRLSKEDGFISVSNSDRQLQHHEEIEKQIEADKNKPNT